MNNSVYVTYNKLSRRYGDIFAFPSDGFCSARLVPNLEKAGLLEETEICRVGDIDIETGVLQSYPPVRINMEVDNHNKPVSEAK